MKTIFKILFVLSALHISLDLMALIGPVRLIGIGNYFGPLLAPRTEQPVVRITKIGAATENILINPQSYRGQLQVVDQTLPMEIEVKFNSYNEGQPYTILLEKEANIRDSLACQGVNIATVKASIKGRTGVSQRICVPTTTSGIEYVKTSPIQSGDFNSTILFVGPLGVNDKYDPDDVKSLPFKFGLMGWTSIIAPWNNTALASSLDERKYTFSKSLNVLQGFAALGGGFAPRGYHASIAHIYNDTDHIIILSRESSNKDLAQYNISQLIPPRTILPYALVWIPKVNSSELQLPGHDGLRIAALKKGQTARTPDTISHSEITEMGPNTVIAMPQGLADLEALISRSNMPVTDDAAALLGVTSWDKSIKNSYDQFDAASHYYAVSTARDEKASYLQKCAISTNACETATNLNSPPAFDAQGQPSYYNMIIKSTTASSFEVDLYPTTINAPRKR